MEGARTSPQARSEDALSIWTTRGVDTWPRPPARMSFTTLRDIETCPLRWGLRRGTYSGLWNGVGYPPAPVGAATAGQIMHLAIERIVDAVAATGSEHESASEHAGSTPLLIVVETLRRLGGISKVLDDLVRDVVAGWEPNPRLRPRAVELANELRRQIPNLRPRVQHFLNRTDLTRVRTTRPESQQGELQDSGEISGRPLPPGLYSEVPLFHDGLGWFGKADLLRVPAEGAEDDGEIIDFKTGVPKPDHALQLRTYALLWARDRRLNPAGRRVQRLTVLYESGLVNVPPPVSESELQDVERDLRKRTVDVLAAIDRRPPEARLSSEACGWCDVRHLCAAYWAVPATHQLIDADIARTHQFVDAAIQIISKHAAWSWIGSVVAVGALSAGISVGDRVLVRATPHDDHFTGILTLSVTFRVLAAQYFGASEETGGLPVLSLTRSTEVFALSESGVRT